MTKLTEAKLAGPTCSRWQDEYCTIAPPCRWHVLQAERNEALIERADIEVGYEDLKALCSRLAQAAEHWQKNRYDSIPCDECEAGRAALAEYRQVEQ